MEKRTLSMIKRMIFALIAAIACVGCSMQQSIDSEALFNDQQTEHIAFEGTDSDHYIQGFTVISDSGIATLEFSLNGNKRDDFFRKYEKDSVTFEKKLSSEEIYANIVFDSKNNFYYAYDPIGKRIKRLDEKFDYLSDLAEFEAFEIKGMDIVGDFLYVLSIGEDPYDREDIAEEKNGYLDLGEKAYRININSGNIEEINVRNPICQFYDGNSLYYYTCENEKYEVKKFDNDNATFRTVFGADDIGSITSFVLLGDKFIYSLPTFDNLYIKNLGSGLITSCANGSYCLNGMDMRLYKGNPVFLNRNIMQVEKLVLGKAPNAENSMKFAGEELVIYGYDQSNSILFSEMKKATGITATIYQQSVYEEERLLKLMACDSDVDIYIIYSTDSLGRSARKYGAYEPLNDCEKINDFLSQCHDYISDFCTNENGDIWAAPISAQTMAIFYVPQNIEKLGLSFEKNFEMYSDFPDTLRRMTNQDQFNYYGYMEDVATDMFEMNYNVNYSYTDYNTDTFKTLLEKTRSGYPRYTVSPYFTAPFMHDGSEFNTEKTAFKIDYIYSHMNGDDPLDTWRVFPAPKIVSAENKNPVILSYAVINPYSKKIDAAKEYLSALAEDFLHTTTKFYPVYKDINKYADDYDINSPAFRDIFDISTNAAIYELIGSNDGMPFLSDYHDGKITADEVVQEFERRAEIALNE